VHKAFEYLEKSHEADKPDVRYVVRVRRGDGSTTGRGIYLREPLDTLRKLTFMADVKPTFHEVEHLMVAPEDIRLDAGASDRCPAASCRHPACPSSGSQSCAQCILGVRTSIWTLMQATRGVFPGFLEGGRARWFCWMPAQLHALRGFVMCRRCMP
jgi:hypothetical protein